MELCLLNRSRGFLLILIVSHSNVTLFYSRAQKASRSNCTAGQIYDHSTEGQINDHSTEGQINDQFDKGMTMNKFKQR